MGVADLEDRLGDDRHDLATTDDLRRLPARDPEWAPHARPSSRPSSGRKRVRSSTSAHRRGPWVMRLIDRAGKGCQRARQGDAGSQDTDPLGPHVSGDPGAGLRRRPRVAHAGSGPRADVDTAPVRLVGGHGAPGRLRGDARAGLRGESLRCRGSPTDRRGREGGGHSRRGRGDRRRRGRRLPDPTDARSIRRDPAHPLAGDRAAVRRVHAETRLHVVGLLGEPHASDTPAGEGADAVARAVGTAEGRVDGNGRTPRGGRVLQRGRAGAHDLLGRGSGGHDGTDAGQPGRRVLRQRLDSPHAGVDLEQGNHQGRDRLLQREAVAPPAADPARDGPRLRPPALLLRLRRHVSDVRRRGHDPLRLLTRVHISRGGDHDAHVLASRGQGGPTTIAPRRAAPRRSSSSRIEVLATPG